MFNPSDFARRIVEGDRLALGRAISVIEDGEAAALELIDLLSSHAGKALRIGITGPPGAGKSTLLSKLALEMRKNGKRVGIIAADPTSPFTGGALLGDRVRMGELAGDEGIFIRSMATRGSLGGLPSAALDVCQALDASGVERIFLETVGVGQSELDIVDTADTVIVVLVPESGDGIQAMKAGLMEIGDIFVVNKADREGAEGTSAEVKSILELRNADSVWSPPVLLTAATKGDGVQELSEKIEEHLGFLSGSNGLKRKREDAIRFKIHELVKERLLADAWEKSGIDGRIESAVARVLDGKGTPLREAGAIISVIENERGKN
ncbi:MAG: methylmalonyl Co-A mutase-associated GTPase MeaB [Candidatus Eisenbacteria bacterium]|nr:methylmalonyl Co-A mutase-associated GTPase MeaB [Candidatus Eisenbacteria bacterium]